MVERKEYFVQKTTPETCVKEQSLNVIFRHQSGEEGSSCLRGLEHSTHHQHLERQSLQQDDNGALEPVQRELHQARGHCEHNCPSGLAEATFRNKRCGNCGNNYGVYGMDQGYNNALYGCGF